MNPKRTSSTEYRVVSAEETSFLAEAKRIQELALSRRCHVVRLGPILFFSTETGDAWMLDPEDHGAVCLARAFELKPVPIAESKESTTIGWNARYEIQDEAFRVLGVDGRSEIVLGYPTAEIQRLVEHAPSLSDAVEADEKDDEDLDEEETDWEDFDEDGFEVGDDPDLSEEENQIVEEWWDKMRGPYLEEPNGGEVLRHLAQFLDEHPKLFPYLSVEDEVLLQLESMLDDQGRYADYLAFLRRLRREQPEVYRCVFGWLDYTLIADAAARGARSEIPQYFSFFRQEFELPFDHAGRVLDLLAWTNCDAELFQLARDIDQTDPEDKEWPWTASAEWLCFREAIPFFQARASSRADAQQLVEAERKSLGLGPEVPADTDLLQKELECTAQDPLTWKFPSFPGRDGIGFAKVGWNFRGWLVRQRGREWVNASFFGRLLLEYWRWPTHRGTAGDPFHLSPDPVESYFEWQLGGEVWPTCINPFAFLQGVVWFGEYLVARGDRTEEGQAKLRETAARLFDRLRERRLPSEVALRLYAGFDALVR